MRFNGKWLECTDRTLRPVVDGALIHPDGTVETFPFLIDTGADSTVLSYQAVAYLGAEVETGDGPVLEGVGGSVQSVRVTTRFWLLSTAGQTIPLGGPLLGRPYPAGDDHCILGRDLLGHFAVVVDAPTRTVLLLTAPHRYVIQES